MKIDFTKKDEEFFKKNGFLITPTGMDYQNLRPQDISIDQWIKLAENCIKIKKVISIT